MTANSWRCWPYCCCAAPRRRASSRCAATGWPIWASLDDVERVLGELGDKGYAQRMGRRPGQKEDRFRQLLGGDGTSEYDLTRRARAAPIAVGGFDEPVGRCAQRDRSTGAQLRRAGDGTARRADAQSNGALEARVAALEAEVADLKAQLADLLE